MNYTKRKRSTIYWQLFFIIIIALCCFYRIWNIGFTGTGQLWMEGVLSFSYKYSFISNIITSVFLVLNAFSLVLFLRRFSLIELRNYYPALFYLLFVFIFPQIMNPWSMLTGFFVIVGILPQLFDLDEDNIQVKTFLYGLWCGILAVIDFYCIFLLFFIYIVCFMNRVYSFRSFILPVVGALVALIYLFSILYLTDNNQLIIDFFQFAGQKMQKMSLFNLDVQQATQMASTNRVVLAVLIAGNIFIGLFCFFKLLSKASSVVINRRKKYYMLLIFILLLTLYILFFQIYNLLLIHLLLILYAIILCLCLSHIKKPHFLFVLFVFFFLLAISRIL